jgi:hypothetical protein
VKHASALSSFGDLQEGQIIGLAPPDCVPE